MKKIRLLALLVMLVLSVSVILVACDKPDDGVVIDENKTQLYVWCVNSGYKVDWLNSAIADYEAANANKSWEEGKMGVQIIAETPRSFPGLADINADTTNEVYFVEHVAYRSWYNSGVFADMTKAVTGTNPYDKAGSQYTTVLSRMTEQQKSALNINDKYYALPHFYGNYGFIYNADLFDKYDWYFNVDGQLIEHRTDISTTRSAGPNGELGDYDDGLPATYEQFFKLCDVISGDYQMTPVGWTGNSYKAHFEGLLNCLIADYEGAENMINRLNLDGNEVLAKIVDGSLSLDSVATTISESNGYEVFRQSGIYYALQFIERLIQTDAYHLEDGKAFGNYTQIDAQDDFIYAGKDGITGEIAMLLDGDWWQQEATETFEDAKEYGTKYERNFKWMPLPKATEEKVGERATDYDDTNGYCFIHKNATGIKFDLAIDFVQFCNSNEQLVKYTQITNTLRPIAYTMTDAEVAELTPFGKSLYEHKMSDKFDKVFFMSSSDKFTELQLALNNPYKAKFGTLSYGAAEAFREAKLGNIDATAESYFTNLAKYWKEEIFRK